MAIAVGVALALVFLAAVVLTAPRYGAVDRALWRWCYRRYLRSGAWRRTKANVLDRDAYACRHCGRGASIVHHLAYHGWLYYAAAPVLGLREDLDDLITVCRECHARLHDKEE